MPLVFIHGVNNRADQEFYQNQGVRDGYFRTIALMNRVTDPAAVTIENPYWGGNAATVAWNNACLPEGQFEAFGAGDDDPFAEIVAELAPTQADNPDRMVLDLARQSLIRAVDCLWAAAAHVKPTGGETTDSLVALGGKALRYAQANPDPAWLAELNNDRSFLETFLERLEAWPDPATQVQVGAAGPVIESFGVGDILSQMKSGLAKLASAARNAATSAAGAVTRARDATVDAVQQAAAQAGGAAKDAALAAAEPLINQLARTARFPVHRRFALFVGDVFVYLDQRGKRGSEGTIEKIVADAIDRADKARTSNDDKLIVVGHSMGGNIAYDVLSYFRPSIVCDLFLTVGSQVGFFEELKMFRSSDKSIPNPTQGLVPALPNIKRWLNVFDPIDVFGYSTSRIFAGSHDFAYDTKTSALSAHGMYFYRPSFHERLNVRLGTAP